MSLSIQDHKVGTVCTLRLNPACPDKVAHRLRRLIQFQTADPRPNTGTDHGKSKGDETHYENDFDEGEPSVPPNHIEEDAGGGEKDEPATKKVQKAEGP